MNLYVTLEFRFFHFDDELYTLNSFPNSFWQRYLTVFSKVVIVARSKKLGSSEYNALKDKLLKVTGERISFYPLPYYLGPLDYLKKYFKTKAAIQELASKKGAFILRVGSPVGEALGDVLFKNNKCFGLEVVGNPQDNFRPGVFKHPLRFLFRYLFTKGLKKVCKQASAVAYVSKYTLQEVFPHQTEAFTTNYSSIELLDEHIITAEKKHFESRGKVNMVFIGSLEHFVKSPDTLIQSLKILKEIVFEVQYKLTIIGDGRERAFLQSMANDLGVIDMIEFKGQIPSGAPIRDELDKADLFVLTSRSEGLPRAMIEAMARGLPCIGSNEGGIVELLEESERVPIENPKILAEKIKEITTDKERMGKLSRRNIKVAKDYAFSELDKRRKSFYQYIKDKSESNSSL